ncbi:hypothetical protein BBJ28_00008277 [Nothophytophthora sp. Chile5]|nr:hypothetical protein BBJ28_00008277 [Nothophytophthora sp. Chile5]
MEGGKRKALSSSFLCSPIPKDPSQVFFVDDNNSSSLRQAKEDVKTGFLDSEVDEIAMETAKENGEYSPAYVRQLQERVRSLEEERKEAAKQAEASESARSNKRQRLEIESVAVSKLKREVATLRIQLENNSQRHQIELKERDAQLDQLRRQLQYAVAEEEETLKELKAATNDHSAETLRLEKKAVELEAQLDLVEANLNEWKEKALEANSQLRALKRQSTMKSEDTILESKIRLLESELKEKSMEAEHVASSLLGAKETLESASDVRALNERITQLQSTERKLKTEVGESPLSLEYEHIANGCAVAMLVEEAHKQFFDYFEPIVKDSKSTFAVCDRPAATVIQLYKARQNAFEILFEQKGNVEIQRRRLEKQCEKLQSDLITSGNHCAKLEMQLAEFQQKISGANDVVVHLRKVNEELVEILETYGKNPDDHEATELSTKRVALLESSLKQSQELIKGMESTQKGMATPAAVKKYEARIERLEKALADAKHENGSLSKHLEKVEMELAIFEKRLGRGEFNVETTKIVHLAVNPTHEMLQNRAKLSDIEKLRQENELLRSKLEKLTGGADTEAQSSATGDQFTTTTSYDTVEGLKKLNQRLKEVRQDQIRQYREAVFLLTGFKVDLKKSNGMELLTLRSVYADHDDDELLVRMEANGSLELLETEYCSQINQRVFAYLTTCRSFPAFLSTLTLHLFEKQTFQGN